MSTVCLQSSDNVCFVVETRIANVSQTIKNMNEFGDDSQVDEKIPIANVSGKVLEKIIEWATHHVVRIIKVVYIASRHVTCMKNIMSGKHEHLRKHV